jgi:hypothetical protein
MGVSDWFSIFWLPEKEREKSTSAGGKRKRGQRPFKTPMSCDELIANS